MMTLLKLANELDEYNEEIAVAPSAPERVVHSDQAATLGDRAISGAKAGGAILGTAGTLAGGFKGAKSLAKLLPQKAPIAGTAGALAGAASGAIGGSLVGMQAGGIAGASSHLLAKRNEQRAIDAGVEDSEKGRAKNNIGRGAATVGGLMGVTQGLSSGLESKFLWGNRPRALATGVLHGGLTGASLYATGVGVEGMAQARKNKRIENELAQH